MSPKDINTEAPDVTERRVADHLNMCLSDGSHLVLVAACDGRVAGYVSVQWLPYLFLLGREGYVSELFIHAEYRGQRIGKRLLEEIRAEAQKLGCARLMLINIKERESYKRRFYAKQGWIEREDAANFVFKL